MYAAVSSRAVEIATLRALGFGAFGIVVSVVVEALALALIGAAAGSAIAWLSFSGDSISIGGGSGTLITTLVITSTGSTFSETTLGAIDVAVRALIGAAFDRALGLLRQHRVLLETGAERLLRQETLERADLDALRAQLAAERARPGVAALVKAPTVEAG